MELNKVWAWKSRKLACRIRVETGNPTGDDLRERFAELAGADLREVLLDMKATKKKKEAVDKLSVDHDADTIFKNLERRSHVLGATSKALSEMAGHDEKMKESFTQRNLNKVFTLLPKSPPKRILKEIQRERSKPLKLPDQNESNEATARIQRRLAKQRAALKAAMNSGNDNKESSANDYIVKRDANGNVIVRKILQNYSGDQFGTSPEAPYLKSMIYMSRMKDSLDKTKRFINPLELPSIEDVLNADLPADSLKMLNKSLDADTSKYSNDDGASQTEEDSLIPDAASKLYCAQVLCNWSRSSLNADRLASEGAVRAIMTLFQETDPKTLKFCAAAFRFLSEYVPTGISMIEEGAISFIGDISQQFGDDDFIVCNLAISLVNLSRVAGKEANVVDSGIVLALSNMAAFRPEMSSACARGLYNLTCVDGPYPLIERVIRALVSLSSSNTASVKHICAAALCNLSDLKLVRSRLVEEGVVNILTTLSRGAETRTRRICSVILQNLSASKSCRVDMTSRNSVNVAYGLSSDPDPIIQRAISLTLLRLAQEPVNISRIIYENGVIALCNIGVKYPNIPGVSEPVATAFQLLSHREEARQSFIGDGCTVSCLASLLRLSTDLVTLQQTLLALGNLLIEPQSHTNIIQSGVLNTILNLCNHENDVMRELCSLALVNFSCTEDSRKHLINGGVIPAIVTLVAQPNVITRRRCSAALCKLSHLVNGRTRMVDDGIVPCLVSLVLSEDLETVHHACSTMCRLCCNELNGKLMMEANAIPNCIKGAMKTDSDANTMKYCGSVLSALSSYDICRVPLIECGIMKVLKKMSSINDNIIKQRCLVAYANLSCETSVHVAMVQEGVIKIISELAESYQEINYICCAKAMCNLACNKDVRARITQDGGVYTLLMISMVHSVDKETKVLCLMALINLFEETTLEKMIQEGIIPAVTNNSKIADTRIEQQCATLFNLLSRNELSRLKLTDKTSYLSALFEMVKNANDHIRIVAAKTCCNLVFCDKARAKAVAAGVVPVLESGILLGDPDTLVLCLKALFAVSQDNQFLVSIAQGSLPSTLANVAYSTNGETHQIALQVLLRLSWDKSSRVVLQNANFVRIIVRIIENNLEPGDNDSMLRTIRFLVHGYPDHSELLKLGLFDSLWILFRSVSDECLVQLSELLRVICWSEKCAPCIDFLSTTSLIEVLAHILRTLPKDAETVENVAAVLLALFSSTNADTRVRFGTAEVARMLLQIANFEERNRSLCSEIYVACLCVNLFEVKCRNYFAEISNARQIREIISASPTEDVLYNAISCIYAMSKVSTCIDFLTNVELQFDVVLTKILQSKANQKVIANCSRTLKNLSSDSTGSLGEGSVSTLISMNLEGKNKNKMGGEYLLPNLASINISKVPVPSSTYRLPSSVFWSKEVALAMAGAAGMGPDPPEPPLLAIECCESYNNLVEDLDTNDNDGKTKMAFAKMPIPADMKSKFILSDADFENANKDDEDTKESDVTAASGDLQQLEDGLSIAIPEDGDKGVDVKRKTPGNRSRASSSADLIGLKRRDSSSKSQPSPKGGSPSQTLRKQFQAVESPEAKDQQTRDRRSSSIDREAKEGGGAKSMSKAKSLRNVAKEDKEDSNVPHNLYT